MLAAADRGLRPAVDTVIAAADPGADGAIALRVAAATPYAPDLVVAAIAPGDATSAWPIFAGKVPRGTATAYVCRGYACEAPTEDPAIVVAQVAVISRGGS
jgi:uncharacterized protein YyaL (SSP411 family)